MDKMQHIRLLRYKSQVGVGCDLQECEGWNHDGVYTLINDYDNPVLDETMALNKAIDVALDFFFPNVHFETNNQNLTRMIGVEESPRTY